MKLRKINKGVNDDYFFNDHISRSYTKCSKKRFMQWFNNKTKGLEDVPEVALCDEKLIDSEDDYQKYKESIFKLEVGQSLILGNKEAIITRVI